MSRCRVEILCLLLVLWPRLATMILVCPVGSQDITLTEGEKAFFRSDISDSTLVLSSDSCDLYKTYFVNFTVYEQLGKNATMQDLRGWQWYEVSFDTEGFTFHLTLMGTNTIKFTYLWDPFGCNLTSGVQISADILTVLGKPGIECLLEPLSFPESDSPFGDDRVMKNLSEIYTKTFGSETRYASTYSSSTSHVIFIPVGAILFCVSFCSFYCRRKNRRRNVQVVRNSTFVRSVVVPIPAGPTPSNRDLPPAYSDLQNEAPPPYSEIDKQVSSPAPAEGIPAESTTSDEAAGEDRNAMKATNSSSSETCHSASSTFLSRMLASRPKNQFDFKPLKNNE